MADLLREPQFQETVSGWLISWASHALTIKVSRLHIHQDGRVTGELLIQTTRKGFAPILKPPFQHNFSSDRTQASLIKSLSQSYPDWPWLELIPQLSLVIQDVARRGSPLEELWTSQEIAPPEWLLEPILYKGLPTIIYGAKAVAKSTLSLIVYACLTLPWVDNPMGWVAPSKPQQVLLLDWEVNSAVALWNAQQLRRGMDLGEFPINYRRCAIPLPDDLDAIYRAIDKSRADVLIIDSLGPAAGGELNKSEGAIAFSSAIRKLGLATLIIAQTSKDIEAKTKSVYGNALFEYFARNIFEIRRAQEEGDSSLDIALFNTYNNLGRRAPTQGFLLNFNGSGTHIERHEIEAAELVERLGTQAKIHRLLRRGALSVSTLADSLDTSESAVRMALSRMAKKGLIFKDGEHYGLSADTDV